MKEDYTFKVYQKQYYREVLFIGEAREVALEVCLGSSIIIMPINLSIMLLGSAH